MPRGRFVDYAEPPERPADPAVRRANLRRIVRLFVPYKLRLSAVLALIVFAAGLGVVPAPEWSMVVMHGPVTPQT